LAASSFNPCGQPFFAMFDGIGFFTDAHYDYINNDMNDLMNNPNRVWF